MGLAAGDAMISYPASLLAVGGARSGIAPVNLLDVEDANGNLYFWSDRGAATGSEWISALTGEAETYLPWLLSCGPFTYNRSLVTDLGSFTIQNLSGNTLARDVETLLRATTLEGATFLYRCWQAGAQAAWIYAVGTLSFESGTDDTARFKAKPFGDPAQEDTPVFQYCETCQLNWAGARCGSTQATECEYSFQSCQVIERPMLVLNSFEKNYGETQSNVPLLNINRSRRV
jgi:hypothetical protein